MNAIQSQNVANIQSLNLCRQINGNYNTATDPTYKSALSTVLSINLSTLTQGVVTSSAAWDAQISSLRLNS